MENKIVEVLKQYLQVFNTRQKITSGEQKKRKEQKKQAFLNYYYCNVLYQFELDLVFSCVLISAHKT